VPHFHVSVKTALGGKFPARKNQQPIKGRTEHEEKKSLKLLSPPQITRFPREGKAQITNQKTSPSTREHILAKSRRRGGRLPIHMDVVTIFRAKRNLENGKFLLKAFPHRTIKRPGNQAQPSSAMRREDLRNSKRHTQKEKKEKEQKHRTNSHPKPPLERRKTRHIVSHCPHLFVMKRRGKSDKHKKNK